MDGWKQNEPYLSLTSHFYRSPGGSTASNFNETSAAFSYHKPTCLCLAFVSVKRLGQCDTCANGTYAEVFIFKSMGRSVLFRKENLGIRAKHKYACNEHI